jgi:hypothetical protein
VGDLDACGGTGGTGGVLQVGDAVGLQRRRHELVAHGVGHGVDGDHAGPPVAGQLAQEVADRLRGIGGRQDHRWQGVSEHGIQAFGMTGKLGREQRNGDGAGMDGGEEADDVLDALRCEDGDAVTGRGDLLHPCADRT